MPGRVAPGGDVVAGEDGEMMRSGGLGERGFLCVGGKLIDESLLDLSVPFVW